uniref:Uncharacterized protein n=1 Tax=Macrococcoides canis TaxID=1855823 RepID=A0A509GMP0_9STAP|nr:hypothetical protein [Macrococcus canis]
MIWQRIVNPETASEYAYIMYDVKNAKAINEGKMKPDSLGIQAVDDYTLKIELEQAVPYFKELLTFGTFLPGIYRMGSRLSRSNDISRFICFGYNY